MRHKLYNLLLAAVALTLAACFVLLAAKGHPKAASGALVAAFIAGAMLTTTPTK